MIDQFQTVNENISIVRGDTLAFGVELYSVDNPFEKPQTLLDQNVDYMYFSVSRDYNNNENVFQKSIGNGITKVTDGKYRIRIAPEDTAELDVGQYYYDVALGINEDRFTILRGAFNIEPDITKEV